MFRQLVAILWKNWLLKKTHALSTLAELVLPVGFMGLLILIKSITSVSDSPNIAYTCGQTYPWYFTEQSPEPIEQCIEKPSSCDQRGYYRKKESFRNDFTGENYTFYQELGYVDSSASAGITSNPMYTFTVADASAAYIYTQPWSWENPSLPMANIMASLGDHGRIFGVAPINSDDPDLTAAAQALADHLSAFDLQNKQIVQFFDSQGSLDSYMTNKNYDDDDYAMGKVAMAVVLNTADLGSATWDYSIRTNFTDVFSTNYPTVACLYFGWDDWCGFTYTIPTTKYYVNDLYKPQTTEFLFGYSYSGFLSIQNAVDEYILGKYVPEGEVDLHASMSFMPTSAYKTDDFQYIIASSLGLFYMLSYLYPVSRMVRSLVLEKENRFKEGMKMMGLTDFAYNLSWAITLVLQMTIVSVLIVLVTGTSVFEYSNKFYVFLYFEMFSLAVINMCFLMATLFSKSKTASLLGPLIFFATYFPYYAVSDPQFPTSSKTSTCLLAPACFALGANVFADFEGGMVGIQAGNVDQMTSNFSYNLCIGMLAFDIFLYGFLAWYLDKIFPSEYGTQLPWYFPFLPSYWCGCKLKDFLGNEEDPSVKARLLDPNGEDEDEDAGAAAAGGEVTGRESLSAKMREGNVKYEPISSGLKQLGREGRAVKLRGLRKVYKTTAEDRVAVDCLNLDLYEGQVSVLLGHNGAGKSTTISMMVGLIPPTAGDAFMFNQRMSEDMQAIRTQLGVCPQHDILFPELTVQQHLQMFAAFKGVPSGEVDREVNKMIAEVGLNEKKFARSATLSGGQKRKLSLGIALIGDSKIIVLDEPTSGMDPYSRRSTWNIIQKNKKGRIILLTTHFMDEADTLGDRIAIMANGKLRCVGSSLYLKKQYGVGYTFTVVKDSKALSVMPKEKQQQVAGQIKGVISSHIMSSELLSDVGAEVSFRLPFEASGRFVEMFRELDRKKAALHVSQYGISVTTLEEVFIKVAERTDDEIIARTSGKSVDLSAGVSRRSLTELAAASAKASSSGSAALAADLGDEEYEGINKSAAAGAYSSLPTEAADDDENSSHLHRRTIEKAAAEDDEYASIENDTPWVVFVKHFKALLMKRFIYGKRDKQMFCCQLVLPVLLVVFGLGILLLIPNLTQPDLILSPEHFNPSMENSLKNFVPFETLNGDLGNALFDRFTGNSETSMAGGGVWGKAVSVDDSIPDQFYGCAQGATELQTVNNFLLGQTDAEKQDEQGSSRYGAITVAQNSNMTNVSYNVMVNGSALHGAGIFMNLIDSALLQVITSDNQASITTRNYPLPRTFDQVRMSATQSAITAAFFFMIAFSFIPASFATFIVKEREIKAKHQQIISGVSLYAYWCSSWVWDVTSYMFTYVMIIGVIFAYQLDAFCKNEAGYATAIVFFLYGPAIASFTYVMSFAFTSHSTAQILVMFFNFVTGLCLMIVAFILPAIPSAQSVAVPLRYLFRIFPSFCLGDSLAMLSFCDEGKDCPDVTEHGYNFDDTVPPLHWNVCGGNIAFLLAQTVVYFLVAVLIEWILTFPSITVWLQHITLPNTGSFDPNEPEDADVSEERRRVASGAADGDMIRLEQLRKVYPLPPGAAKTGPNNDQNYKVAVQSLSFAMPKGECFGFLGINGAGKTTTLSILSGEFPPTSGTAYIDGFNIKTDQSKIRRKIGYCPQFDALLELLTVREHLELYARIKGIRGDLLEKVVQNKLAQMNLHDFEHKAAGSLSGGNKRKLSVAIALIAEPSIVFLDEPSTGMDPMARRFMWDVIARVSTMDAKCSVVLTTHSMEEAEALCTRIGIMVNGRLRCLGSGQHLKNRFGSGYEVDVKTRLPDAETLQNLGQYLVDRGAVRITGLSGLHHSGGNPMAEAERGSESTLGESDRVTAVAAAAAEEAGMMDDDLMGIRISAPLHGLCTALNKPQRAALIAPNAEGQAIYNQMQVDGSVTLKVFLEWWVAEDYAASLIDFMNKEFLQQSMLLERASAHSFRFRIPIPMEQLPLADIFERIERSKEALCIKDYAVGQTTLEQIFNQFAASQDNPEVEAQQLQAEIARRQAQQMRGNTAK